MRYLKTNTATIVTVGPFYDKTDGVTIENSLTITNERITFVVDANDGSAPTLVLDNVTGATSGTSNDLNYITNCDAGLMQLELAAANVNYVGRAFLTITDAANHVPVFHEFTILPANIYDSMIAGTDLFDVSVTQWLGTAAATPTTAGVPEVDITHWNGTAIPGVDTAGYPKVTIKDGTGTGEIDTTSGRVIANVTYWNGTAVATPDTAGYPKVTIKNGTGTGEVALTSGAVGANVTSIGGSTTAATAASKAYQGVVYGTFATGTLSATSSSTDLTGYGNDTFNGRTLTVITGARAGEQATISDHVETNGVLTYSALTGAPSNGDEFFIA